MVGMLEMAIATACSNIHRLVSGDRFSDMLTQMPRDHFTRIINS